MNKKVVTIVIVITIITTTTTTTKQVLMKLILMKKLFSRTGKVLAASVLYCLTVSCEMKWNVLTIIAIHECTINAVGLSNTSSLLL